MPRRGRPATGSSREGLPQAPRADGREDPPPPRSPAPRVELRGGLLPVGELHRAQANAAPLEGGDPLVERGKLLRGEKFPVALPRELREGGGNRVPRDRRRGGSGRGRGGGRGRG